MAALARNMIHIACAADAKFVPHCGAMLTSLLRVQRPGQVCIHFIHDASLGDQDLGALQLLVESLGGLWHAHEVPQELMAQCEDNWRFGKVAWYRMFLPEIVSGLDRILYLDSDMIVCRSLDDLWITDMKGKAVAGVLNPLYPFMDKSFLGNLGLAEEEYYNSGLLLIDLKLWRSQGLSGKIISTAEKLGAQEWPDQNAINVALRGQWFSLLPTWNCQNTIFDLRQDALPFPEKSVAEARRDPAIVHFIGKYKPWHYRCKHNYRSRYWENLKLTPWNTCKLEGISVVNIFLRAFPEVMGWRMEEFLRTFWRRLRLFRN